MNELPNEILLKIFAHLPAADLVNLSRLCRRFNALVSSPELTQRLTLSFRKLNHGDEAFVLARKYSSLRIGFFRPQLHTPVVQERGAHFSKVDFAYCKLKLDVVRRILCLCPHVKSLSFTKVDLSDVPKTFHGPLPLLIDVDVKVVMSDPRIFRVLLHSTAKSVTVDHKHKNACGEVIDFMRFLFAQRQLTEMNLLEFFRTNLFMHAYLDVVNFRLKTLRLTNVNLARTDHFKVFLENNQLATLEVLEIHKLVRCNITELIANCPRLRELRLDGTAALEELEELPTLERLTLFAQFPLQLNQLIHKFPALREIETHYCRLSYDEEEFMKAYGRLAYPGSLARLSIIDTTVARFRTTTIKALLLRNVKIGEDFFELNCGVEELHVEDCDFDEATFERITTYLTRLKRLTIVGEKVSQETIKRVNANCAHLELLRLSNIRNTIDLSEIHASPRRVTVYLC